MESAACQCHHNSHKELLLHLPAAGETHAGETPTRDRRVLAEPGGGGQEGHVDQSGETWKVLRSTVLKLRQTQMFFFKSVKPKETSQSKEAKPTPVQPSASDSVNQNQNPNTRHKRIQEHEKERKELFSKPPAQVRHTSPV